MVVVLGFIIIVILAFRRGQVPVGWDDDGRRSTQQCSVHRLATIEIPINDKLEHLIGTREATMKSCFGALPINSKLYNMVKVYRTPSPFSD